jgi:hypothetical protein
MQVYARAKRRRLFWRTVAQAGGDSPGLLLCMESGSSARRGFGSPRYAFVASGGSANAIAFPSGSGTFTWRTPFE